MKEVVKDAIHHEMDEDWNMVEIMNDYVNDLMLDYPELTMPQARAIFKGALARHSIGSAIRTKCKNLMETGNYEGRKNK